MGTTTGGHWTRVAVGNVVVIVLGVAAVAGFVGYLVLRRNDPERAASHEVDPQRTGSAQFHGDVDDRPAGPGAEADGVAGPGEPTPGPSAESATDHRG
jgi:hypothetical protein